MTNNTTKSMPNFWSTKRKVSKKQKLKKKFGWRWTKSGRRKGGRGGGVEAKVGEGWGEVGEVKEMKELYHYSKILEPEMSTNHQECQILSTLHPWRKWDLVLAFGLDSVVDFGHDQLEHCWFVVGCSWCVFDLIVGVGDSFGWFWALLDQFFELHGLVLVQRRWVLSSTCSWKNC